MITNTNPLGEFETLLCKARPGEVSGDTDCHQNNDRRDHHVHNLIVQLRPQAGRLLFFGHAMAFDQRPNKRSNHRLNLLKLFRLIRRKYFDFGLADGARLEQLLRPPVLSFSPAST